MSEKTVHWPGSDGSRGLHFSDPQSESDPGQQPGTDETIVIEPADGSAPHDSGDEGPPMAASPADPGATTSASPADGDADFGEGDSGERASAWSWEPMTPDPADDPTTEVPAAGTAIAGAAGASRHTTPIGASQPAAKGATPSPSVGSRVSGARRTRKARLRLARIDPWSVMKTAFLFSIAFAIMVMVIVWVIWSVLAASGVLESLNQFLVTLVGDQDGARFDVTDWINGPRVLGLTALMSAISVVILTAVTTLFAFLYNLAASVIGGLEITLAED